MAPLKSPDAFRTISEVADWLGVNAHVLRFWESKFSQIKPVKRAGGRRYYRKSDMELLGGIKQLLHEDGLTIKGAQKVLREQGVKAVCALSKPVDLGAEPEEAQAPIVAQQEAPEAPALEERAPAPAVQPSEPSAPSPEVVANETVTSPESPIAPPMQDDAGLVEDEIESAQRVADALDEALANAPSQPSLFEEMKAEHGTESAFATEPSTQGTPPIAPLPPLPSDGEDFSETEPTSSELSNEEPTEPAFAEPSAVMESFGPGTTDDEEPAVGAEPAPTTPGPAIAPLPVPDLSLTDALARLAPGQIEPADLAPILDRAKALRARMELAGAD